MAIIALRERVSKRAGEALGAGLDPGSGCSAIVSIPRHLEMIETGWRSVNLISVVDEPAPCA